MLLQVHKGKALLVTMFLVCHLLYVCCHPQFQTTSPVMISCELIVTEFYMNLFEVVCVCGWDVGRGGVWDWG